MARAGWPAPRIGDVEWVALALLAVAVVAMTALVATGRVAPALLAEPTRTVPPLEPAGCTHEPPTSTG